LKAEEKECAISCHSSYGPVFGGRDADICISHNCNANTLSGTDFRWTYTNDTALDRNIVFTGSRLFIVKEIEVFEITD
jgi:hypothetical protein